MTDNEYERVELFARLIAGNKGIPLEDAREIAAKRLGISIEPPKPRDMLLRLGGNKTPVKVAG